MTGVAASGLSELFRHNLPDQAYYQVNGVRLFHHSKALQLLIRDSVVALQPGTGNASKQRCDLVVPCNGLFAPNCPDQEELGFGALEQLYQLHQQQPDWGWAIWCCLQRGEKPVPGTQQQMQAEGAWDEVMEQLADNGADFLEKTGAWLKS